MRHHVGQAFAVAAGLLGAANAQGFFGSVEAELAACGSDNFLSLGCFPNFEVNAGAYFNFSPLGPNPSDPSRSFPDWDPGSEFNSTVTPLNCARVCRGYGYKFSALRDNNCNCGIQLPLGYEASAAAVCDRPCDGDATQTCGGGLDAQIYLDPTFAENEAVPPSLSNPVIASYYQYLGCYNNPNGFPTQDVRAAVLTADIDSCFNLCAGLGYPLVHGAPDNGQVRCTCGTAFGFGSFRVDIDLLPTPGVCNTTCDAGPGVFGDCDISSQRCCGQNGIFPVYINTELQGCYTPLIPGIKQAVTDELYVCDDIPDTLTGPPAVLPQPEANPEDLLDGDVALIRRPTVAVPGGDTFYLYGCLGVVPSLVFEIGTLLLPGFTPATLDNCATQCDNLGFNAFGMINGVDCYCAPGLLLPLATVDAMRTCRVPCQDDTSVSCGGVTTPIVYTTNSDLGIYPELVDRLALPLPEYECDPRTTTTRTQTTTTTTTTTSTSLSVTLTTTTSITTTETTTSTTTTGTETTSTTTTGTETTSTTTTDISTTSTTTTGTETTSTTTTDVSTTSTTTTGTETTSTTTTDVSITSTTTSTTTTDISTTITTTTGTETTSTTTTATSTSTDVSVTSTSTTTTTTSTSTDISTTSTTTSTTRTRTRVRVTRTTTTSTTTTTTSSTTIDDETSTRFFTTDVTRTRTRTAYTTVTTGWPWPTWGPWPAPWEGNGNEPWTGGGWGPAPGEPGFPGGFGGELGPQGAQGVQRAAQQGREVEGGGGEAQKRGAMPTRKGFVARGF